MRYWPNPAHKSEHTEAGPPAWKPGKTKCPRMEIAERTQLLEESLAEDPEHPGSTRYALRVGPNGIEWFAARLTRMVDGEPEFHGYPCSHVKPAVLRRFKSAGRITEAEYRRFIRELA